MLTYWRCSPTIPYHTNDAQATAGDNQVVNIWERNGNLFKEIELEGNCSHLDWSRDGGHLAITHDKSADVILWDAHRDRASKLPTGDKHALTFLKWSTVGMTLAIGTAKGTLVLYNHVTSRKIPVYGKHGNKAITCGAWNSEGQLCLGGLDKSCTISDESGSTVQQLPLHGVPSDIAFHEVRPPPSHPFPFFCGSLSSEEERKRGEYERKAHQFTAQVGSTSNPCPHPPPVVLTCAQCWSAIRRLIPKKATHQMHRAKQWSASC